MLKNILNTWHLVKLNEKKILIIVIKILMIVLELNDYHRLLIIKNYLNKEQLVGGKGSRKKNPEEIQL